MARAVEQYAGLRLLRQEPWECLVSYVCSRVKRIRGTRSSVKAIATLSPRHGQAGGRRSPRLPRGTESGDEWTEGDIEQRGRWMCVVIIKTWPRE